MPISRRSFLGLSASALAGFTLDPDRLLWRPGARTIFIPAPSQSLYYSTIVVGGLVQRGQRISSARYSRLLGKEIVWADNGERRIDVTFPWRRLDDDACRGIDMQRDVRIVDLSVYAHVC